MSDVSFRLASHDLKAPLRGIDNLASWIEEDMADAMNEESREHMGLLRGRVRQPPALIRRRRRIRPRTACDLPRHHVGFRADP